jgi:hypothetical protein
MVQGALDEQGNFIVATEALGKRDQDFYCLCHEPAIRLFPREGVPEGRSDYVNFRRAHFAHQPGYDVTKGKVNSMDVAVNSLYHIARAQSLEAERGRLEFLVDEKLMTEREIVVLDRTGRNPVPSKPAYHVVYLRSGENDFVILPLSDVPVSTEYIKFLDNCAARKQRKTFVPDKGAKRELNRTVYVATVLVKNSTLYRLNDDKDHKELEDEHLKLGPWLGDALTQIYSGVLAYFDPENLVMEKLTVEPRAHDCRYTHDVAAQYKTSDPALFCQRIKRSEDFQFFSLWPVKRKKDTFTIGIRGRKNPALTIAQLVPNTGQMSLL